MKVVRVRELGTEITGIPGVEHIRIEPSEKSDRGAHVVIKLPDLDEPISFGIEEFGRLAGAIALANDRVRWLADRNEKDA